MGTQYKGKDFEQDFAKSKPSNVFVHRIRDLVMFAGSSSICDYIVYKHPKLFLLELKSHKGQSIPIKEKYYKDGKKAGELQSYGVISRKQLEGLYDIYCNPMMQGVECGFIFNFREKCSTFYIPVEKVWNFIKDPNRSRSSIPMDWCQQHGVRVPQRKKISRYTYDYGFLDLI